MSGYNISSQDGHHCPLPFWLTFTDFLFSETVGCCRIVSYQCLPCACTFHSFFYKCGNIKVFQFCSSLILLSTNQEFFMPKYSNIRNVNFNPRVCVNSQKEGWGYFVSYKNRSCSEYIVIKILDWLFWRSFISPITGCSWSVKNCLFGIHFHSVPWPILYLNSDAQ